MAAAPESATLVRTRYDSLRRLARFCLRSQPPDFTLSATELAHEVYARMLDDSHVEWENTGWFRAISARRIKQVLIDHIRRRRAQKRGGPGRFASRESAGAKGRRVELSEVPAADRGTAVDFNELAAALAELADESRRHWRVVMLRKIEGHSTRHTAELLGVSESGVEKDLRYGLAWLRRRLARTS